MIERFETNARMSQVVVNGGTIYLAGQVPDDPAADISTQTQQVLSEIDRLLAIAGAGKGDLLSATIWLRDMTNFAAFNEVWENWIPSGHAPARACVQAALARPGLQVEIGIVAARV